MKPDEAKAASVDGAEAASSWEDRIRQRIEEVKSEIAEVNGLIERTKQQQRQLQEAYFIKVGELAGLKRLLGEDKQQE